MAPREDRRHIESGREEIDVDIGLERRVIQVELEQAPLLVELEEAEVEALEEVDDD